MYFISFKSIARTTIANVAKYIQKPAAELLKLSLTLLWCQSVYHGLFSEPTSASIHTSTYLYAKKTTNRALCTLKQYIYNIYAVNAFKVIHACICTSEKNRRVETMFLKASRVKPLGFHQGGQLGPGWFGLSTVDRPSLRDPTADVRVTTWSWHHVRHGCHGHVVEMGLPDPAPDAHSINIKTPSVAHHNELVPHLWQLLDLRQEGD